MNQQPSLYLASASPRRQEILSQLNVQFGVVKHSVEEVRLAEETPLDYVERLAKEKAQSGLDNAADKSVPALGADTIVVLGDSVLEKPKDKSDAIRMLLSLSEREHQVITALSVTDGQKLDTRVVTTRVWFTKITQKQAEVYWQTGEPKDKAGAYGIQGLGGSFVKRIDGSYSAVVGLPLYETAELMSLFSVPYWATK